MVLYANHMERVLNIETQAKLVRRAIKILKPVAHEFDYIAISGMSGALIAPIVSQRLKKPLLLVRKETDSSHSAYLSVEGVGIVKGRYIILDDFISSGATVRFIRERITKVAGTYLEYVGMYMWRGVGLRSKNKIEEEFGGVFYGDVDAE